MLEPISINALLASEWTPVVAGEDYVRFGLQLSGLNTVHLTFAETLPAPQDLVDYLVLSRHGSREFSEELGTTDVVYARSSNPEFLGNLRGYKVSR